jgi:hypothetical protein
MLKVKNMGTQFGEKQGTVLAANRLDQPFSGATLKKIEQRSSSLRVAVLVEAICLTVRSNGISWPRLPLIDRRTRMCTSQQPATGMAYLRSFLPG